MPPPPHPTPSLQEQVWMCPSPTFWVSQAPSLLPARSPGEEKPPLCGLLGQVLSPINGPGLERGMERGWREG